MVDRFKTLLEKLNVSAAEMADKIGVQRSSISHILSGRNKPSVDFLDKIIRAFPEVSVEWLITGNGNWNKPLADRADHAEIEKDKPLADIADRAEIEEDKKPEATIIQKRITSAQSIDEPVDHIIIVYKDNTFRILNPA